MEKAWCDEGWKSSKVLSCGRAGCRCRCWYYNTFGAVARRVRATSPPTVSAVSHLVSVHDYQSPSTSCRSTPTMLGDRLLICRNDRSRRVSSRMTSSPASACSVRGQRHDHPYMYSCERKTHTAVCKPRLRGRLRVRGPSWSVAADSLHPHVMFHYAARPKC